MNHLEPHSSSLKSSFLLTVAIKFQSVDCFMMHVIGSKISRQLLNQSGVMPEQ